MKISFLVTYYQQEKYVRESMESILNLKKPAEWELLVGDDGSTDGTAAAVQAYADRDPEHIRLYVMDRDPGEKTLSVERASLNRLNLLSHATGDCFCLIDGDDFYSETDFVPEAVSLLEANPEVNVVGFDTWMYYEGRDTRPKEHGRKEPVRVSRGRYLRWQYTHAGACVIRRNFTEERMEMNRRLKSFDDNGIVLNALAGGELIRVHRPVLAYRQTEGSVYSGMNSAERAALNVSDMGAALELMGAEWEKEIMARYATAVWMAWFLRKTLRCEMDPDRFQLYLAICGRAGFARGEQLLRYPELTEEEKKTIRKWVRRVGRASPPRVLYAWINTRSRGKKR